MPVTDTTSVTRRPPQSLVSTTGNPPRSRPITAITTRCRQSRKAVISAASRCGYRRQQEQQDRDSRGRREVDQTGRPTSGSDRAASQRRDQIEAAAEQRQLPSLQQRPARRSLAAALAPTASGFVDAAASPTAIGGPAHAETLNPPPCSRKNATTETPGRTARR